MKKITLLLLIISSISFSQTRTLESNLEGLILEVGDSFTPETYVKYNDGSTGSCEVIIYYNKKGVFNVGGSIVQDPSTGNLLANEPGNHEVVAVCIDPKNDGERFSKTFSVFVNYSSPKAIKLNIGQEFFSGNYIPLTYSLETEKGNSRDDVAVNISSSNPLVVSVDANNLLKAEGKGKSNITLEYDGVKVSKEIKVLENPVHSINIKASSNSVRAGDVVTLNGLLIDKKGKELDGLNPTFSFQGKSFDSSNSASGLIMNNKFVADIPVLYL